MIQIGFLLRERRIKLEASSLTHLSVVVEIMVALVKPMLTCKLK
jgi:hypothetical protein